LFRAFGHCIGVNHSNLSSTALTEPNAEPEQYAQSSKKNDENLKKFPLQGGAREKPPLPYSEGSYVFICPNVLFSKVTYLRFLDTNDYLNENHRPDLTAFDEKSAFKRRRDINVILQ